MQTKLTEEIVKVTSAEELSALDKKKFHYAACKIARVFNEDFIDEDTGETVTIERNEFLFGKGDRIQPDDFSQLLFHFQAGDLKEASFSNQRRVGYVHSTTWRLWKVSAEGFSTVNIILYAPDIIMAHDIAKDFIELNYRGSFTVKGAKTLSDGIVIEDEDSGDDEENKKEKFWYSVTVVTEPADEELAETIGGTTEVFIVYSDSVDSARVIIEDYIAKRKAAAKDIDPYVMKIVGATVIKCNAVMKKSFCLAYAKDGEEAEGL